MEEMNMFAILIEKIINVLKEEFDIQEKYLPRTGRNQQKFKFSDNLASHSYNKQKYIMIIEEPRSNDNTFTVHTIIKKPPIDTIVKNNLLKNQKISIIRSNLSNDQFNWALKFDCSLLDEKEIALLLKLVMELFTFMFNLHEQINVDYCSCSRNKCK